MSPEIRAEPDWVEVDSSGWSRDKLFVWRQFHHLAEIELHTRRQPLDIEGDASRLCVVAANDVLGHYAPSYRCQIAGEVLAEFVTAITAHWDGVDG